MTTEPYTARHLGWDYMEKQARAEGDALMALDDGITTAEPRGRHAAYDPYRITDPSTRLDMQMADEEATA